MSRLKLAKAMLLEADSWVGMGSPSEDKNQLYSTAAWDDGGHRVLTQLFSLGLGS